MRLRKDSLVGCGENRTVESFAKRREIEARRFHPLVPFA
jgi:hypothetical protein